MIIAIIHSLKCVVPFSFVVPLLSLAVIHCHSLSLFVTRFTTCCHSLSFVVTRCHSLSLVLIRCHSLSFYVTRCHSLYHSLSLVVIVVTRCTTCCTTRCHSLSLDISLACLFINNHLFIQI